MDGTSLNIIQERLCRLKTDFPEIFTEGKIDMEKFKATFTDDINFNNERYVLNWAGKSDAFKVLQIPTTATLKPQQEESVNFNTTQNVFIEGENLEVLKVLQKSYYGKIKCIIIDPPYNTGNDSFIYPDSFKENKEEYQKRIGEKDEEGYLMKEGMFRKNSKDSGHYHSNWLSMMYPRLFLAKNLLREDGVIFVHIDDNEVHNLRMIMNEIFGEENFITTFSRLMKTGGAKGRFITPNVEYILAFAKNINSDVSFKAPMKQEQIDGYYNKVETEGERKGEKYGEERLYKASLDPRANQRYWIQCPDGSFVIPPGNSFPDKIQLGEKIKPVSGDGVWKWTFERYINEVRLNNIVFKETSTSALLNENKEKAKWNIYNKLWLNEQLDKGMVPANLIDKWENRESSAELKELDIPFDFAKPSNLIKYLLYLCQLEDGDIILDFFAGSSSTAHGLLKHNNEVNKDCNFILVQLPEPCVVESEAYKAGYKTIADISKERIRRVIKKIEAEQTEERKKKSEQIDFGDKDVKNIDLGFKSFKLSPSNFKIWRGSEINEENLVQQLDAFTNPVREGSEKDNMLYEMMLKAGYLLTDNLEKIENFYSINSGELLIAIESINQVTVDKMIALQPQKVISLDILFKDNDQLKTNTVLQMRDAGIDFKTI
jgi:adenine-specific DNA-methyltransferase